MEMARLKSWLTEQIESHALERTSAVDAHLYQAAVRKLCELRKLALTGTMEGMGGGAKMQVDDPAPFVARIDVLLDGWRARFVELEGEPAGRWVDTQRGLLAREVPVRTLRADPSQADALLKREELEKIESFVRWLHDPVEVARTLNGDDADPNPCAVYLGRPDPAGLREVAELFEETFETMFPPELAALLSRVNGFDIFGFQEAQATEPEIVEPDELGHESAVWSTAFDFESGIEQALTCADAGEDEFAWPLEGVNFQRFYYVTGPIQSEGRPELTVWTHLQGQREREKVGTFWDWLEVRR